MNPDDVVPLVVAHVEQHPVSHQTGVIDHDVDAAEVFDRGAHHGVGGAALGHITLHEKSLPTIPLDFIHEIGVFHVVDHDAGTRGRQRHGFGAAEAGSGSGDNRDPALDVQTIR